MRAFMTFGRWLFAGAVFAFLAGCAGTVQRDSSGGAKRLEGTTYKSVDVVMSDAARRLQAENPQFNAKELGGYVQRRLDAASLVKPDGRHRVEVTVENFRVRNAFAAVMFGFMAGSDSIDGYVRVFDEGNRQVHGYKVNASYALGGWAGGQDSMRMNWMYEKFSELTVAELAGTTAAASLSGGGARPSTDPSRPRTAPAPTAAQMAEPRGSGFARLDDVDAVPHLGPNGKQAYRDWLKQPAPKAFASGPGGAYFPAWGLSPQDTSLPTDPAERAVTGCSRAGKTTCKLYAVNNTVVWAADAAPAVAPQPVAATPAPRPVAVATPVVAAAAPAAIPTLATGYARVDDVDAVPFIADKGRESYRDWLTRTTPRAFALSPEGHWAATWTMTPANPAHPRDPSERAMFICQERSKGLPCRLYAVNGAVVWPKDGVQLPTSRPQP